MMNKRLGFTAILQKALIHYLIVIIHGLSWTYTRTKSVLLVFVSERVMLLTWQLQSALRLPHRFLCRNGTVAGCIEGLCILLRRLAYPIRLTDMIPMFGRSKWELSMIFNDVVDFVFNGKSCS